MPDNTRKITPDDALKGESPLVLIAHLEPVAGLDRFQPAGFPEIGHVVYRAPREDGTEEPVCIVDSPASMANHLESVCLRGAHDLDLVDDISGMPYLRCVTGTVEDEKLKQPEAIVTSLTEGHRIASTYFLEGRALDGDGKLSNGKFVETLVDELGIVLPGSKKAHPPAEKWWDVFRTIFRYDPNALVHGVLFPQWNIKIPRFLTAHLEAFGAARVDRAGVKFDRLGKTTSGQPIFAVDDAVAQQIRATFVLDVNLVRSFGRNNGEGTLGLGDSQKEFLVALALWKIQAMLKMPFRFRSGCHLALQKDGLKSGNEPIEIVVDIKEAIRKANFNAKPCATDIYWPREELYRDGKDEDKPSDDKNSEEQEDSGEDED